MQRIGWKRLRRVGGLATALVCALTLSACIFADNVSPVELGIHDGHASLAFCKAGTVESIRIDQRPSTSQDQWETVWEGTSEYEVRRGDVLIFDGTLEGFAASGDGRLDVSEGTKYALQITYASKSADPEPVAYAPSVESPSGGLRDGSWLNFQGSFSDKPCG